MILCTTCSAMYDFKDKEEYIEYFHKYAGDIEEHIINYDDIGLGPWARCLNCWTPRSISNIDTNIIEVKNTKLARVLWMKK